MISHPTRTRGPGEGVGDPQSMGFETLNQGSRLSKFLSHSQHSIWACHICHRSESFLRHVSSYRVPKQIFKKTDLKYQKWLCSWKKKERPGQQNHIQRKIIIILLQASFNPVGGPLKELAPFIGGAKGGSAGFLAENELAELGVAGEVAEVLGTLAFRKWKQLKRKPKQNPKCPMDSSYMMLNVWKKIIIPWFHDDTWTIAKVVIWKVTKFLKKMFTKSAGKFACGRAISGGARFAGIDGAGCRGIHLLSLCLRRFRRFRYRCSRVKRFRWYCWVLQRR